MTVVCSCRFENDFKLDENMRARLIHYEWFKRYEKRMNWSKEKKNTWSTPSALRLSFVPCVIVINCLLDFEPVAHINRQRLTHAL